MATKRSSRKSSSADLSTAGRWIFLLGLALAAVAGLAFAAPLTGDPSWQNWVVTALVVLGLVGGYLHIGKADEHHFILLAIGLAVFADHIGYIPTVGNYLASMLSIVSIFTAAAVVALFVRNAIGWFRS
jgi:hypothetical protein